MFLLCSNIYIRLEIKYVRLVSALFFVSLLLRKSACITVYCSFTHGLYYGYYIILGVVNAVIFLCSDGIEGLVVARFL